MLIKCQRGAADTERDEPHTSSLINNEMVAINAGKHLINSANMTRPLRLGCVYIPNAMTGQHHRIYDTISGQQIDGVVSAVHIHLSPKQDGKSTLTTEIQVKRYESQS